MFLQSKTQPFKKQPFKKRLDQNTTFWEKVGPKYNLLEKGWAKIQPRWWEKCWTKLQPMVGKMLDQNTTFLKVEFGPTFFT